MTQIDGLGKKIVGAKLDRAHNGIEVSRLGYDDSRYFESARSQLLPALRLSFESYQQNVSLKGANLIKQLSILDRAGLEAPGAYAVAQIVADSAVALGHEYSHLMSGSRGARKLGRHWLAGGRRSNLAADG